MTDEGMFRTLIRLTWVKRVNRWESILHVGKYRKPHRLLKKRGGVFKKDGGVLKKCGGIIP